VSGLGDGDAVSNGRQHMLERLASGHVIVDVAGRHQGQLCRPRQPQQLFELILIIRTPVKFREQVAAVVKQLAVAMVRRLRMRSKRLL